MVAGSVMAPGANALLRLGLLLAAAVPVTADERAPAIRGFLERYCFECHDDETKKGELDLSALKLDLGDARTFVEWVKVHDRVRDGEMPPKKKERPESTAMEAFLEAIARPMVAADRARSAREGRATWRRLNRYEYENTLRDLLQAPWLQIK